MNSLGWNFRSSYGSVHWLANSRIPPARDRSWTRFGRPGSKQRPHQSGSDAFPGRHAPRSRTRAVQVPRSPATSPAQYLAACCTYGDRGWIQTEAQLRMELAAGAGAALQDMQAIRELGFDR